MPMFTVGIGLASVLACSTPDKPKPEKIQGLWELHQIETPGGDVDAKAKIAEKYPACVWGRMTWTFDEDHLAAGYDILCAANPPAPTPSPEGADPTAPPAPPPEAAQDEFYGCQVQARVPATWDPERGAWHVASGIAARSRTVGLEPDALQVPTSCEVTIDPGDYPVVRVRTHDWRWEMRTPEGTVYRLKLPESDRPDFVAAIKASVVEEP